jgi:cysteine desulfurase
MLPYFGEAYGNPSSTIHELGRAVGQAVEGARHQVATLIGAKRSEIFFTSGATESNNLALFGLAHDSRRGRRRIVTTSVEHKAVLGPCQELAKQGFDVVVLQVNNEGKVELEAAEEAINDDTLLVSIQAANNEIGTIQPLAQLARLAHDKGALLHCDAAQAVGKIPVNVGDWDVDLLSISAHKLYGPKGVGALYIRGGPYALPISPILVGGGQEKGLRAGTLNVPAIVGLGEACHLCEQRQPNESIRTAALRDRLEAAVLQVVVDVSRNGALENRLPGNSSLTFPDIDAEALVVNASGLAISTGSACTSGAPEPSHVLSAIGLNRDMASSTVRIGVGRFNTEEEMDRAAGVIVETFERLARMRI